jgi:hypothetical protein
MPDPPELPIDARHCLEKTGQSESGRTFARVGADLMAADFFCGRVAAVVAAAFDREAGNEASPQTAE